MTPEGEVENADKMLGLLKIMADRNRLRVLGLLAAREYSLPDLARDLAWQTPAVFTHLAALEAQGLVEMRTQNGRAFYRLKLQPVWEVLRDSREPGEPEATEASNPDAWERNILNRFFESGKLKEIPSQHKKRMVVLKRLVQEFDVRFPYPETWVNETLKQFHPDCASLRRYLVDDGLMVRVGGIYRRLA